MAYRGSSIMEHYCHPLFHQLPLRSFSAFKFSKDLNPAICLFTSKPNFYFTNEQLSSITILHAWYMHLNMYSCKLNLQENIFTLFSLSTKTKPPRVENCSQKQSFVIYIYIFLKSFPSQKT